ncbi:MAG: hypothetical protein QNI84_11330 [Henriciella sp.]|nr:hypothetical protein [Henriciella sp.]
MKPLLTTIVLFLGFGCVLAHSEPYTLNTGERLVDSEFITTQPLFGKAQLVLEVEFEPGETDRTLRNLSLIELLAEHLLPTASRSGFERVSIWEALKQGKVGPETSAFTLKLSAGAYENYDFELGKDWIWNQTSGPDLDLSAVTIREHNYNADLNAYITEPLQGQVEEWTIFEVWASVEGASPSEAAEKANEIFQYYSGCTEDGVPVEADSFIGQQNAIAFRVYMLPNVPTSPLQLQPRLKFTYGHEDYVAHCYTVEAVEAQTWDELYKRVSEK